MAKSKSVYVCSECGAQSPQWLGRCPNCGKFGTLVEEITESAAPQKAVKRERSVSAKRPVPLSEVKEERYSRVSSGIAELDTVLGGGIVPGSLVLIGGDPGIGKSTLLTEVSAHLSEKHRVLYVSAEESCSQVKMRCARLKLDSSNLLLLNETCLEDIEDAIEDEKFVVIDSIQAVYTSELSSAAGSVGQVRECAGKLQRIAKSRGITFFIVGHVTKEGALAGPKVLEHIMDTVLYFEGEKEDSYKILRAYKNRFGSVQEVGVFEMTDAGIFGNLRAAAERAEHGAQLHRVGELRIAVDHPAALAQAVGVDGEGPGAQLHRRLHGPLEKIQVGVPLDRVDEGELRVPVEAGDADARVRRGAVHCAQVLVRPAPELHEVKAVGPGGPEPLQEGELAVHRLDAGGSLKHHVCASSL